jgi:hypothetical protein
MQENEVANEMGLSIQTDLIVTFMLENRVLVAAMVAEYNRSGAQGMCEVCRKAGYLGWDDDQAIVDWDRVEVRLRERAHAVGILMAGNPSRR